MKRYTIVISMILCIPASHMSAQERLITLAPDGKLIYAADAKGNVIPDFSNCGYRGGGVALPRDVPVKVTVQPQPQGDDGQRIEAALDQVGKLPPDANGIRGAVLLGKGKYRIAGAIHINHSGVILRGEGDDQNETVLIATGNDKRALIQVGGRGHDPEDDESPTSKRSNPRARKNTAGHDITDAYVPVGAHTVTLEDMSGLKVGGEVREYAGPRRLLEVGIEKLRGVSEYSGDTDEEHAWILISLSGVENSWVRGVTAEHFTYSLVTLSGESRCVTVQDCASLDPISQITGGRRYSFCMNHCHLCLVQRCFARNGRHDFVTGATVAGPNVFLDCKAEETHADSGPHHRWSVGTLYENLVLPDGQLNIRDRGNLGSGHGWAGANQVCWNCQAKLMNIQNPPTAQNWAIGCTAKEKKGDGVWESVDHAVMPRSLYLAQLKDRLGEKAVTNIRRD